jgi:hypothetical protein
MPTANPRINVTLSPSLYSMVEELAKHQRISRSMVLRELLEASEPALAQVVAMMKAAENMTEAAKQRLNQDMGKTLQSLEAKADQALSLAAGITSDLVSQAEAIRGRRPRKKTDVAGACDRVGGLFAQQREPAKTAPVSKRPPSSNRGVKSTTVSTKTIAAKPRAVKPKAEKTGVKTKGVKQS